MYHEIVFAGFGGQGVLFAAQVLAYAAMMEGDEVAWIPSYGPEMRGGAASAGVMISDDEIGSLSIGEPTAAVVMNPPSLDKFEPVVTPGGVLVINRSLIYRPAQRPDLRVFDVPANDVAMEVGNDRLANVVALGTVLAAVRPVSEESVIVALAKNLTAKKAHLLAANEAALRRGMEFASAEVRIRSTRI